MKGRVEFVETGLIPQAAFDKLRLTLFNPGNAKYFT